MNELTYEDLQELEEYIQLDSSEISEHLRLLLLQRSSTI